MHQRLDWRQFPPAIFPVFLGLIALGLVWIRAGHLLGFGSGLGQALGWLIFAVSAKIYLLALALYLRKICARVGVFCEDLTAVPGRQGIAAMTICLMLIAAGLVPVAPGLAAVLLVLALAGHIITALLVLRGLIAGPRVISPALHLVFVGFIVASQASALLEMTLLTFTLFGFSFAAALVIYGLTLEAAKTAETPPPLRPLEMIHLAPVSLFGTTAMLLHLTSTALICGAVAVLVALVLLVRLRGMMAEGFGPAWAAFAFPVLAFTGLMLALGQVYGLFLWIGLPLLFATTLYVPVIAYRLLKMCLSGELAQKTGAATV